MNPTNIFHQILESLGKTQESNEVGNIDIQNKYITFHSDEIIKKQSRKSRSIFNNRKIQRVHFDQALKSLEYIKASIALFSISTDTDELSIEYISENTSKILQIDVTTLQHNPSLLIEHIHAFDYNNIFKPAIDTILKDVQPITITYRFIVKNSIRWINCTMIPEKIDDSIQVFTLLQDVTKTNEAWEKAHHNEELTKSVITNANIIAYTYSPFKDKYIFIENSISKILSSSSHTIPSTENEFFEYIHPEDTQKLKDYRSKILDISKSHLEQTTPSIILRFKKELGIWSKIKLSETLLRSQESNEPIIHGVIEDISHIENLQHQLYQQGQLDNLTKLPNRSMFIRQASENFKEFQSKSLSSMAILLINMRRFKVINDSLGYLMGDELITELGKRIRNIVDSNVYVSRFGSDEFALIINNFSHKFELENTANKLVKELSKPFFIHDSLVHTIPSIGICIAESTYNSADELITNAGRSIREAQNTSKDFSFYNSVHNAVFPTRFKIENDLINAIDNNELELWYMPQYSLTSHSLIGCESLIRWNHHQRGLVSPADFIPIAQETGLIAKIDNWVVQNSCKTLSQWTKSGFTCPISINLSSSYFNSPSSLDTIQSLINQYSIPTNILTIEITEDTLIKNLNSVNQTLTRIKELGISIAIDDFGTGYSSLAYLKELSIDILKIDQKFLSELSIDQSSQAIVKSIINLAKLLDIEVIAEGVETLDQAKYLKNNGCDIIQGYLISKALPNKKFIEFFNSSQASLQNV